MRRDVFHMLAFEEQVIDNIALRCIAHDAALCDLRGQSPEQTKLFRIPRLRGLNRHIGILLDRIEFLAKDFRVQK